MSLLIHFVRLFQSAQDSLNPWFNCSWSNCSSIHSLILLFLLMCLNNFPLDDYCLFVLDAHIPSAPLFVVHVQVWAISRPNWYGSVWNCINVVFWVSHLWSECPPQNALSVFLSPVHNNIFLSLYILTTFGTFFVLLFHCLDLLFVSTCFLSLLYTKMNSLPLSVFPTHLFPSLAFLSLYFSISFFLLLTLSLFLYFSLSLSVYFMLCFHSVSISFTLFLSILPYSLFIYFSLVLSIFLFLGGQKKLRVWWAEGFLFRETSLCIETSISMFWALLHKQERRPSTALNANSL